MVENSVDNKKVETVSETLQPRKFTIFSNIMFILAFACIGFSVFIMFSTAFSKNASFFTTLLTCSIGLSFVFLGFALTSLADSFSCVLSVVSTISFYIGFLLILGGIFAMIIPLDVLFVLAVCLVSPSIFFVIGISLLTSKHRRTYDYIGKCTAPVTAVCVNVNTRKSLILKNNVKYFPVFEFKYKNTTYQVTQFYGDYNCKFNKGDKAALLIQPENPIFYCYEDNSQDKFLGFFGVSFLLISAFLFVFAIFLLSILTPFL